jgi:hypothetical protein
MTLNCFNVLSFESFLVSGPDFDRGMSRLPFVGYSFCNILVRILFMANVNDTHYPFLWSTFLALPVKAPPVKKPQRRSNNDA